MRQHLLNSCKFGQRRKLQRDGRGHSQPGFGPPIGLIVLNGAILQAPRGLPLPVVRLQNRMRRKISGQTERSRSDLNCRCLRNSSHHSDNPIQICR